MTAFNLVVDEPTCDPRDGSACDARFFPLIMTLETLTRINQWHFRCGRAVPLADSGVYYKSDPDWEDCVTVTKRGWGDCKVLATYLCAELRELYGIPAECVIKYRFFSADEMRSRGYPRKYIPSDGMFLVHVVVRLPNGVVLDPSKWLGMRGDFN